MPILDTVLAFLLAVAVLLVGSALFLRQPLSRLLNFFRMWSEQDARRAEEASRDAALRERAEAELDRELNGPSDDLKIGL